MVASSKVFITFSTFTTRLELIFDKKLLCYCFTNYFFNCNFSVAANDTDCSVFSGFDKGQTLPSAGKM